MKITMTIWLVSLIALVAAFAAQGFLSAWNSPNSAPPRMKRKRIGKMQMTWGAMFMRGLLEALVLPTRLWERFKYKRTCQFANIAEGTHANGSITKKTDSIAATRYLLWKKGSDANHVDICGATDDPIGVCRDEAAAVDDYIAIDLFGARPGTHLMVASEAINAWAPVYAAASGKVASTGTKFVGLALVAAAADGDEIEVLAYAPGRPGLQPIGYGAGAGGAVTQITSRATGVTINTLCGTITTDPTSLAAGAEITFTVTNSKVAANDVVVACVKSGGTTPGSTQVAVTAVAAGSFDITINNLHAATADTAALVINFSVIKSVAA